jgi:hypothetical protein
MTVINIRKDPVHILLVGDEQTMTSLQLGRLPDFPPGHLLSVQLSLAGKCQGTQKCHRAGRYPVGKWIDYEKLHYIRRHHRLMFYKELQQKFLELVEQHHFQGTRFGTGHRFEPCQWFPAGDSGPGGTPSNAGLFLWNDDCRYRPAEGIESCVLQVNLIP